MLNFKHDCFVRVDDAEQRKELINWLEMIGYEAAFSFSANRHPLIIAENDKWYIIRETTLIDGMTLVYNGYINCDTNIYLFKAIAAINDENDYMQWFTDGDNFELCKGMEYLKEDFIPCDLEERKNYYHKATPPELIEYFKNK